MRRVTFGDIVGTGAISRPEEYAQRKARPTQSFKELFAIGEQDFAIFRNPRLP